MNRLRERTYNTLIRGFTTLLFIVVLGTFGFRMLEKLSWVDSFYMTILSISTVGFEVVKPLSQDGKIFVSILIILSLGNVAYVGSIFVRFFFDGEFFEYIKTKRMNEKVSKLSNHVIVCGFGRNGEQVASELVDHEHPFVVVEKQEHIIELLAKKSNMLYVNGDATHEDTLDLAGIKKARALIATTPSDAENIFMVLTAKDMNPNLTIISRASEPGSAIKLRRAGASNIIMPERMGGQRMARLVTQPDVVEFVEYILMQSNKDVSLNEVSCRNLAKCYVGKTLGKIKTRQITEASIIGAKDGDGQYVFNPGKKYVLRRSTQLFVFGLPEQVKNLVLFLETPVSPKEQ